MSYISDYKCGAISESEYRDYATLENRKDRYYEERMEMEDAAKERCYACEGYDEETGFCELGEKPLTCNCCN